MTAIAEQLTEEKVLIPSAYTAKYFPENCRNRSFSDPYRWNANTIGHILDRQEYLGHTVLGKSICENFKTKQRRAATPEELMIFPDTHEAIIDQDTWDIAQKLRVRAKPRAANGTYSHRLSGMIYCAERKKEREEERMAADPEYAAMMAERKAEYTRTRTAKRQAEREALVELAKTDEEAAKKLAEMRKYQSQATVRSYQKMKADAEAGDPDAIKRYETTLAKRREEYHRKKGA